MDYDGEDTTDNSLLNQVDLGIKDIVTLFITFLYKTRIITTLFASMELHMYNLCKFSNIVQIN